MKRILPTLVVLLITGCGSSNHYIPNPVDQMIKIMKNEKSYTIILDDMDVRSDHFYHKYLVLRESKSGEFSKSPTDWLLVNYDYFKAHEGNLGMQIVTKDSIGKVSKVVAPAGYANYVGNSRYGNWQGSGSDRFWVFYGQYAFMRSIFGLGYHPCYYPMYNNYYSHYYGTNRSFYGTGHKGGNYYGTSSSNAKKRNFSFFERKARNNNWSSSRRTASSRRSGRGSGFGYGK